MRPGILTVVGVVALLGSAAKPSFAQGSAKLHSADAVGLGHGAKVLLDKGIAALEGHDLPAAGRLLSEAFRQSLRSEVLYQLGRLAQAEGRELDAYDLMRRYLADPSHTVDEAATRAAEALVNQPVPPSGSLSVLSTAGALVLVDNRVVATLPLVVPLLVSPGPHTVQVELPDKRMEAPVAVKLGRLAVVRLSRASGAVLVTIPPAILFCPTPAVVPTDASRLLADSVEQAARDEQYTLLRGELLFPNAQEYKRCLLTKDCVQQLAVQNNVELVLEQDVRVQADPQRPSWQFTLRLTRLQVDEPAATGQKSCAACSIGQAAAALKEAAAQVLAEGLLRPRGTLSITAEPAAAAVLLGEQRLGPLPYRKTLWAGRYEVTATHPGYQPERRTIEVVDGKPAELHLELQTLAPLKPESGSSRDVVSSSSRPRPRWRLAVGSIMLGAGVALTAAGAAGLVLDGQCNPDPGQPLISCPQVFDTIGAGAFSLASGLLLIGSGGLLMGLPERRH